LQEGSSSGVLRELDQHLHFAIPCLEIFFTFPTIAFLGLLKV
jgi:hypothetical protein